MLRNIFKPFGQIAVWLGFAEKTDITVALDKQKKADAPQKIGKILQDDKTLGPKEVDTVLKVQKVLQKAAESKPATKKTATPAKKTKKAKKKEPAAGKAEKAKKNATAKKAKKTKKKKTTAKKAKKSN